MRGVFGTVWRSIGEERESTGAHAQSAPTVVFDYREGIFHLGSPVGEGETYRLGDWDIGRLGNT